MSAYTLRSATWPMPTHHPRVIGTRHMVASANYLAAQTGFQILEAGGNAIDAGVAGGIALGVIQCEFVHFAGVAPIMVRIAETGETWTVSGLGTWPAMASAEHFRREHGGRIPPGILRAVVPGAPDAWITALERWGTMTFGEVAQAAIRFAREGFPVSSFAQEMIADAEAAFRRYPQNERTFLPKGRPPQPGELLVQAELADTLEFLAAEERAAAKAGGRLAGLAAARRAFYDGEIAAKIDAFHAANGGWLRRGDLASFRVDVEPAMKVRFGDVDLYTCGPWCQGPVLAQSVRMLDGVDLKALGHNSPAYVHRLAETLKLAFADRHAYYGDPKFVRVPMDRLLADDYVAARRDLVDPERATPGMPDPGDAAALGLTGRRVTVPEGTVEWTEMEPDTSYLCVVDRHGNLFSATPSDGTSGGPMVTGTGLVPSNRGAQSWTDPDNPSCLAPGKRPRLTPSPAIAVQGARAMPFGTPGNDVQPQAMLQVFLNTFVWGMTPQQAIEQPRFATTSFPRSSDPHEYFPGRLEIEMRFPEAVADDLARRGHQIQWWRPYDWHAGCVSAIVHDRATGLLEGGADQRRPGGVAGW
jgi:gamma-glutamyltranspeptidase/glutathione hydrolase